MKLESLLLRGLFVACLTVCGLIVGAMLLKTPTAVRLATDATATPTLGTALIVPASQCALPPDGVVCPRQAS
ncbi:MAG: hypothetical protein B7X39_01565 [Lysobacterales bacterium 14-68-21]|jgi:hypothetical protein|nr:MAG: hypothetical protein B7X45_01795 [Xanthomonadales bacterium 15-68-25]OZB68568.1 MAG: hypothetical protein B7X39_01565 [Xanthomonadales bacterium 14-68-21]